MGVSFDDINKGVLETSKVLKETMSLWDQITGKSSTVATPPIAPVSQSAPAGGSTSGQRDGVSTASGIPQWVWLAAIGGGLLLLMRR